MPTEYLNDARIKTACDEAKESAARVEITDAGQPGLLLRLYPNDRRVWSFRYRSPLVGGSVTYKIGAYDPPHWTIADARREARRLRVLVDAKRCPKTEREAKRDSSVEATRLENEIVPTFGDMVDAFILAEREFWRPSSLEEYINYLTRAKVVFGKRELAKVTPDDIRGLVDAIRKGTGEQRGPKGAKVWFQSKPDEKGETPVIRKPAPASATHMFSTLHAAFVWAVADKRLAVNPCTQAKPRKRRKRLGLETQGAQPKVRVKQFTNAQIRGLVSASAGTWAEYFIRLALLTGVRVHTAMSAEWSEIDLERGYWNVPTLKHKIGVFTGAPHIVPITAAVANLLTKIKERNMANGVSGSSWVFPPRLGNKEKCDVCGPDITPPHINRRPDDVRMIKKAAGITDYGFAHRFRDTISTRMYELETAAPVVEHTLGHKTPGMAGVYNHAELLMSRRAALEWWAGELDRILAGTEVAEIASVR